ncbi:phosphatidylglycerophosphatase A [Ignatzschineria ureiclastica]|uniref:Phosphatidylglycerophosphatase A n=1 Tax=Ignatzschineria ureiclastica TaxID=472582 RepID=A0A2U2AGZ4_9GAMM|nr:phosphatidylglycerophosphatase A [Ignatzschineria ureiclastica]PWD81923.1 phosphatidylglycerophosphatase A [Ignatzschineria ureiclastica]GGZ91438.1 phosphatidylglycerophosphatase A [Ignatzschineria ureiclastica]
MTPKITIKTPWQFFASGFGSGMSPVAPGTMGTLASIPFWFIFATILPTWGYIVMLIITALVGIVICQKASDELGVHDHGGIVWDEFVGLWLTMLFAPVSWTAIILGFLIFRFFDVLKPWPIKVIDAQVGGGLGIMLDDILAGIFSLITLQVILHWIIPLF